MNAILFVSVLFLFGTCSPAQHKIRRCYKCFGKCDNSDEELCGVVVTEYVCTAATYLQDNNVIMHQRKCSPNTRDLKVDCEAANKHKNYSCYTCNTDLCNDKATKEDVLDFLQNKEGGGGVKKCYNCKGKCSKPRIEKCEIKDYLCQEVKSIKGGVTVFEQRCVQKTKRVKDTCNRINKLAGTSCYTCGTELCNNKYTHEYQNTAETYSAPEMLLATLVSQFLAKLLTI